jgi:galactokinase
MTRTTAHPAFEELFGIPGRVRADAPGRVNLIGEHTDYNGGYVLPIAIPQRTHVEAARRPGDVVRLWSAQAPESGIIAYTLGAEVADGRWADYVKGMTLALAGYGALHGFDARIESDVPVGSGLSSSAALEIAIGRALRELFALAIDDVALAVAGRRAENDLVGAPVGIMDQMAASLADTTAALFLDTRTLAYSRVTIPPSAALIVIDSGLTHRHAGGEYATRRRECAEAAAALGVGELRDVAADRMPEIDRLPAPLDRRARHVVTENQRVLDTVEALRAGQLGRAGELLVASHASLRHDFEVSLPEIDELVDLAGHARGVYGARMTGGGFGGAIVALCAAALAADSAGEIVTTFNRDGSRHASVLVPS